jgi:uncharacterized protein (TIGR04255 family)
VEREIFSKNKIVEAVCQFSITPNLGDLEIETIRHQFNETKRYESFKTVSTIHLNINLKKSSGEKIVLNGIRFQNKKGDKVVQIFPSKISVHQIGNYEKWEVFREDILKALNIVQHSVNNSVVRIDLKAMNIFDQKLNYKEDFNINLNYPDNLSDISKYNFSLEQVFEKGTKFGTVKGNYTKKESNEKFVLDLQFTYLSLNNSLNIKETNELLKILEEGHIRLNSLFMNAISDKTKQAIR